MLSCGWLFGLEFSTGIIVTPGGLAASSLFSPWGRYREDGIPGQGYTKPSQISVILAAYDLPV